MASLDLYSTGPMRKASITLITSETDGFPKENALDNNPDTAWRATSTAQQIINIDLEEVRTIDGFAVWIRNYLSVTFQGGHRYALYSDDNDDGLYSAFTLQTIVYPDLVPDFPIQLSDDDTPVSKRYWRIIYDYAGSGAIPDIGGFFLLQKNTISKSSQLPRNDVTRYHNRVSQAGGGREFVRNVNSNSQAILPRTYLIQQSDFTALQAAFDDSRGRQLPLIAVESGETTRLVRFTSDDFGKAEISHETHNPTFGLIELAYVPDGEIF